MQAEGVRPSVCMSEKAQAGQYEECDEECSEEAREDLHERKCRCVGGVVSINLGDLITDPHPRGRCRALGCHLGDHRAGL